MAMRRYSGASCSWDTEDDEQDPCSSRTQLVMLPMKSEKRKKGVPPLAKVLRRRELYGRAEQFNRTICRVELDQMKCPYAVRIGGAKRYLNITRECVFIGLSNDSRYAVALVWSSSESPLPYQYHIEAETEEETELNIIIFELSTSLLRPAFIATFDSWPNNAQLDATFPCSSSHISIVGFTKQNTEPRSRARLRRELDPFSVIAEVKFILFRFNIQISMVTCLVMSYRWKGLKMSRTVLRSTDHGGILNGGTALVSYLFTRDCPPVTVPRVSRVVLQVVDPEVVGGAEARIFEGCFSHSIKVKDATAFFRNKYREYALERITVEDKDPSPAGLSEPLFFTETVIDIERLLYEIMPIIVPRMYGNYKYEGLIDYEVDLIDCAEYTADILVTAVIEAKGPGEKGRNSAYIILLHILWDTFNGTRQIYPWRGMRMIDWAIAHRPDKWYPFRVLTKVDAPDERVLSNMPFLYGKSLEFLASPSPGITIWKELPAANHPKVRETASSLENL